MNKFCSVCDLSSICLPIGPVGMARKLDLQIVGTGLLLGDKFVECCSTVALLAYGHCKLTERVQEITEKVLNQSMKQVSMGASCPGPVTVKDDPGVYHLSTPSEEGNYVLDECWVGDNDDEEE